MGSSRTWPDSIFRCKNMELGRVEEDVKLLDEEKPSGFAKPIRDTRRLKLCCGMSLLAAVWLQGTTAWWMWRSSSLYRMWNQDDKKGGACPASYDADVMAHISHAARVAFCNPPTDEVYRWSCGPCKDSNLSIVDGTFRPIYGSGVFGQNGMYAYTVRLSGPEPFAGGCLLAFQGTHNLAGSLIDADAILEEMPARYKCSACHAHRGFLLAWEDVEPKVVDALQAIGCSQESGLIVTGHSLGASVATLAAWSLAQVHGFRLRMLFAFESPRVGDPAFHSFFDKMLVDDVSLGRHVFRLSYHRDAVPHLPPRMAGFEHVNCEVYYAEDGIFRVCNDTEDPTCAGRWAPPNWNFDMRNNHGSDHCQPAYNKLQCTC
mmetsp:Transcript_20206/g.55992  ORF Transcript_20206/g.55992 Transcript_20206/m.55992 type:complete len:374 (+) Transcript_20206:1-1122(+)